jgi:hypothetical protein
MSLLKSKRVQIALIAALVAGIGALFPSVSGPVSALAAAVVQALGAP